ncbi:MAG: hypothetical protein PUJ06_04100 [Stecheria intestinalis]|nr:hypothetical protein [Stecheria intestinalis]
MTNYEKIMSEMTPEKLAELISENTLDNPCQFCAYYRDSFLSRPCKTCSEGIEEWLKQEEEKDGAD